MYSPSSPQSPAPQSPPDSRSHTGCGTQSYSPESAAMTKYSKSKTYTSHYSLSLLAQRGPFFSFSLENPFSHCKHLHPSLPFVLPPASPIPRPPEFPLVSS